MAAVNVTPRVLSQVTRSFEAFRAAGGVGAVRNQDDYERAMALIEAILDATRSQAAREDAGHPLAPLLDFLTAAVHDYEAEHHALPEASARDVLRFLMDQHGLSQSALPEVGNQSVVSQILAGRRALNTRQIAALARRFHISADALIDLH